MKVLKFGGGLNSTALLIECTKRGIIFDLITFADTGGELPETMRHVKRMSQWCIQNGQPPITIVWYVNRAGERVTLESNCLKKKMLPSLAYGYKKCSLRFKAYPQEKLLNSHPLAKKTWEHKKKVVCFYGIDADEPHRKRQDTTKYRNVYPLIEWDIGRHECGEISENELGYRPGKSSCFFCPAMKKKEITDLREQHPQLFRRAIAMEKNANLHSLKGLGRYFSWEHYQSAICRQVPLFDEMLPCHCTD